MSLFQVERFIFQLKHDEKLQTRLRDRDPDLFEGFDVTAQEQAALRDGEVEALYAMGVHPLLLAPFSRYAGIKPADYHRRLSSLEGSRDFSSGRQFVKAGA